MSSHDPHRPRLAIPAQGAVPSFDQIYALAAVGVLLDQATVVVCLTEEILTLWRRRLRERIWPADGLELVDGRFGWSADWRAFFRSKRYDLTFFHGFHAALQDQSIPPSYAKRLVGAASAGLIVLA